MSLDDYLTPREAADRLGLNYHTVMARIRRGQISTIKRGWNVFIPVSQFEKVEDVDNTKTVEAPTR